MTKVVGSVITITFTYAFIKFFDQQRPEDIVFTLDSDVSAECVAKSIITKPWKKRKIRDIFTS